MTDPSPNRWRGVPADERQAERRGLLLDAAFELLGTVGAAGTTVRGVCEAARLNPRYFYESFEDLDSLLVAVFDREAELALHVMLEAAGEATEAPDVDPLELTKAGIGSFVRHVTSDPRRAQVLFVEGLGNEAMGRRRIESMHDLAELIGRGGEPAGTPLDIDPIVQIASSLLVGGMAELLISWLHGRLPVSLDQLVEDAALLFVATGDAATAIAEQRGRPPHAKGAAKRRPAATRAP